ncbi:Uncharacterised protein [Vibrio cholerae]|nr:Uncharacterised protein [Vibrio cholerae]
MLAKRDNFDSMYLHSIAAIALWILNTRSAIFPIC